MLIKILHKDFLKNKVIYITLCLFIALSALLVASGTNMITELVHSMNALFAKSNVPHFVQMHAGKIDRGEIDTFAEDNPLIKNKQIVEMLHIDASNIELGNHLTGKHSVMDHYFVKQNSTMDRLLNLDSEVLQISKGEIAVPVYFRQRAGIKLGDKVKISNKDFDMEWTVVDFVRDAQMNPSVVHSKRFVLHETDLNDLKNRLGEVEYLIEFQLKDPATLNEFRNIYQSSNLPQQGPTIDYHLFKALNALTDGIVATVVLLVSLLLMIIAILCIRFTVHAAIEEDIKEIGVMKAIGISLQAMKKIYLFKYIILAVVASLIGYILSTFLSHLFTNNIMLYIGMAPKSPFLKMLPLLAVFGLFMIIVFFCVMAFNVMNKISAVEALRSCSMRKTDRVNVSFPLSKNKFMDVPTFLGFADIFGRFKLYRLLLFVFFLCSFIIIVPVNFLNTIQSSDFIQYMGVERSDVRIDIPQVDSQRFAELIAYIQNDQDVKRYAPLSTSQFKVLNQEGIEENIMVEIGDFSIFPLEYLKGSAPIRKNEIALSYLNSKEMQKTVGDTLRLILQGKEQELVISGIYQDVTNGGRTAKALLPMNHQPVLWYEIAVDFKTGIDIQAKKEEYAQAFYPSKVTDLKEYLKQTFGNTVDQLKFLTTLAIIIALFISTLITSLFLKMLVAKDFSEIAIMKRIGFSPYHIRKHYIVKIGFVLGVGIILGTITSNTVGESLVSGMLSLIGAAKITFVIDPVKTYILCPLIVLFVVITTTILSTVSVGKIRMED